MVASISALAIGGLTLLMYAWSIGQLPDFTWNDLTGTLLAVCATGVLVVAAVVLYCLSAGYFARAALEAVYPEAAHHVSKPPQDPSTPAEPYVRIIRGPFILGATCFSVLAWVGLFIGGSRETMVAPHNEHLIGALIVAIVTMVLLLLVDWRRFRRQWPRYSLLSIFAGAAVVLVVVMTAWSVGPDNLVTKGPMKSSALPFAFDWAAYSVAALNHVILIGAAVAIAMSILLNFRMIASFVGRLVRWLVGLISWKWPGWLVHVLAWTSCVVVGDAPDRRLIKAKVYVTTVFCLFTIGVFTTAYAMASMGSAHDWNVNFFFIVALLTVLNWVSFSVRNWKERAGLGLVTAGVVFISYPLVVHNPAMFPKMVVSLLGLGNERLATIALSSRQCATLATYGVSCVADNDRAITLTNVNMLNRLGSSVVLELLIEDEGLSVKRMAATSTSTDTTSLSLDRRQSPKVVKTLVATSQMGAGSPAANFCDKLLLSKLDSTDAIDAHALRCVELVVPKDQVLGYSKENWRNYRGEYTAYQPGPAKAPLTVSVVDSKSITADSKKAVVSVVTTAQR